MLNIFPYKVVFISSHLQFLSLYFQVSSTRRKQLRGGNDDAGFHLHNTCLIPKVSSSFSPPSSFSSWYIPSTGAYLLFLLLVILGSSFSSFCSSSFSLYFSSYLCFDPPCCCIFFVSCPRIIICFVTCP